MMVCARHLTRLRVSLIPLMLLSAATLQAESIGSITYLEQEVRVVRAGRDLVEGVDFGFPLESFDLIQTGAEGFAEILLDPRTGIQAQIMVEPSTSFYLDVSDLRSQQTAGIELLTGSLAFRVNELVGSSDFEVRTETAVMGVRGTDFIVVMAPAGDVLVVTTEGRVEVSDSSVRRRFARPGEAVERLESGEFRNLDLGTNPEEGAQLWLDERMRAFYARAESILTFQAARYLALRTRFFDAWEDLQEHRDIIDTWVAEDRRGELGSRIDQIRQKRRIIGSIIEIRRAASFFHRLFYRLRSLASMPDLPLSAEVAEDLTLGEFFSQLRNEARLIEERLNSYRQLLVLYARRNDGVTPLDSFGGGM